MIGKYPVITLCGSTRFKDQFLEAQKRLTLEGNIVISVGLFGHSGDDEVWENMDEGTLTKTKEMLAWLTNRRGALCSNNELMAVLWEDDIKESYFRNIRADLLNTLPEELFVRQRGKVALRTELVSCDYYDWIKGIPEAINAYNGEYMAQYSWGEWSMDNRRFSKEEAGE